MALGASAFLLAALVIPALQLRPGLPSWLIGVWGAGGIAVLILDGRVKRSAQRGKLGPSAVASGALLVGVGVATCIADDARSWVSAAGIVIAATAAAGLLFALAGRRLR